MQMYEPHKEDVRDYIAHFRVASPHTRTRLVAPVPPSALQQENLQTVYFKAADADDDCELINLPPSSSHQSQSKPQQPAGQQSHVLAPHASPSTPVETIEQNDKQLKTLDPSFFALFRHASTLPPKPWMGGAFGEDSVYSAATASTVASTSRVMTNNQGTKSRPFLHSQSQANLFPSSPSAGQQSMRMTSSASSPFLVGAQGGRGTSRQGGGTGRAASPPPGERARSPPRFSQTHSGSWRQQGGMEGGGDASANRTNRLTATPSVLGFGCQTPRWNGEEVYKGWWVGGWVGGVRWQGFSDMCGLSLFFVHSTWKRQHDCEPVD
uniref:Uncharacterized protein n=1 Tax=Chromera velia CCMP2878 TaxID=1169474 RepID=A0A0G4GL55_9ALVE|eukprot:Cvel_22389.t1-p1 / transcript=Cvel_22389.t1 / gene=Cvel_22389 / organism=Chromera_velia_CCMP2878 / gene_product=hypothetical protein / transcript_product=hypothetical protein / location=Cvel_scaffold2195:13114-14079(+) / protein_length=322 / sequence_SO=supercontig / SO=protein_coding / is_pseudo=false